MAGKGNIRLTGRGRDESMADRTAAASVSGSTRSRAVIHPARRATQSTITASAMGATVPSLTPYPVGWVQAMSNLRLFKSWFVMIDQALLQAIARAAA